MHLPKAAAIVLLVVAMYAADVDYREGLWEWAVWPRTVQASVLIIAAAAMVLALVRRGSLFSRLFGIALGGSGIVLSLNSLSHKIPEILWPNTVLMAVFVAAGMTLLLSRSNDAERSGESEGDRLEAP
jgi:hypothetical protein